MTKPNPPSIPLPLMILDGLGALLLGLGLAEWLAGTDLMPQALRFDYYPQVMVIVGALLMLPMILHLLRSATGKGPREI